MSARASRAGFLAVLVVLLAAPGARGRADETDDPLGSEIERWSAYLRGNPSTDEIWTQVKESSGPALGRTAEALHDGRRLLALQRLDAAREGLAASRYLDRLPPEKRNDPAAFEAEWARLGKTMRNDLESPSSAAFDGVQPAAVRALAEAAAPQVRIYYEASLEYGRNTMAINGLFYLGAAQAQRDFAALCRSLSSPSTGRAPPMRALGTEMDALERDLLAVYRPPVSIDRHTEFILASGRLKEARELDAAGLRYGELLRYLEAALRFAPLRPAPAPALEPSALEARLRDLESRLAADGLDHSLGRLFLEAAQADLAAPAPGKGPVIAAAIAADVLPRYLAALEPARPAAPRPSPRVTVTLVRWPYT